MLEIGYTLDPKDGSMVKGPKYQRIVLKGWHEHTAAMRATDIQVPAGVNMRPFLNRNVDAAAWAEWKKQHADSWLLKNEILFEAKDEASAQLRVIEGDDTPAPFAPLKKSAVPGITTADFAKEKEQA